MGGRRQYFAPMELATFWLTGCYKHFATTWLSPSWLAALSHPWCVSLANSSAWFLRFEKLTMTTRRVREKRPSQTGQSAEKLSLAFNPDHLALPEDEIRRLVLLTTTRYKIEPFVRQLIRLMDALKAGKTNNIAKLTRPGRDTSRAILFAAIAKTVGDGRTVAAYHTSYQAALYAYENSLDHLLAFHEYLGCLRQKKK